MMTEFDLSEMQVPLKGSNIILPPQDCILDSVVLNSKRLQTGSLLEDSSLPGKTRLTGTQLQRLCAFRLTVGL